MTLDLWLVIAAGLAAVLYGFVTIKGLMGMATFTDDKGQIRKEFSYLNSIYLKLKSKIPEANILSMGMSGDYKIAIEEGSTMVRIGSSIFGVRNNQAKIK